MNGTTWMITGNAYRMNGAAMSSTINNRSTLITTPRDGHLSRKPTGQDKYAPVR